VMVLPVTARAKRNTVHRHRQSQFSLRPRHRPRRASNPSSSRALARARVQPKPKPAPIRPTTDAPRPGKPRAKPSAHDVTIKSSSSHALSPAVPPSHPRRSRRQTRSPSTRVLGLRSFAGDASIHTHPLATWRVPGVRVASRCVQKQFTSRSERAFVRSSRSHRWVRTSLHEDLHLCVS